MRDFTLHAYSQYVSAIKATYEHIFRFDEYFSLENKPENFCLIRHDVDRKPQNALKIAELEYKRQIRSSYFFRTKSHTFKPEIIQKIAEWGHAIGYHYESLSDTKGNMNLALIDFEKNLEKLRRLVPIRTIAMHGRPFSKYDNRDMWRGQSKNRELKEKFKILGEVYLNIDYSDIAYITDTGRNWHTSKANKRDITNTNVLLQFETGKELLQYFQKHPHPKMVFQIHPERWTDRWSEYGAQYLRDVAVNMCKQCMTLIPQ